MAACRFDWEIFGKVLCILLLLLQGGVLDYYLVTESKTSSYLGFITTDIVVLIVWLIVVFIAKVHCNIWMKFRHPNCPKFTMRWKARRNVNQIDGRYREDYPDELPYAFVAWLAYTSITLVPEVAVIFKNYADDLEDVKVYGQNILKIALCITPILFLLLVNSHHNAHPHSSRKWYVDKLTGGVTLDLIDSIDLMDILFLNDFKINLPAHLENAIIAFACINFFLPTLALLELSVNKFDGQVRPVSFQVLYSLSYILLVNVPFSIIRLILWFEYNQDVSVFIAKNIIMTFIYIMDIRESLGPSKPKKCPTCGKLFLPSCLDHHRTQCHLSDILEAQAEVRDNEMQPV
ncbi:uncharacterized protein LOC116303288 [Actinia tenebrosa]|uniref:Uncharacterized protein LOC116303288 n=1 Tax=Actinia tenebrosa TaxID=6105 RepID=A0A6P8IP55_ACTTE|nr:uncharacterized protein LOC116303288 [Actinia tenebrosa]